MNKFSLFDVTWCIEEAQKYWIQGFFLRRRKREIAPLQEDEAPGLIADEKVQGSLPAQ